ncbi:MAG TPA: hypothetical protein ENN80_10610, partial [Candidatus Hydrogenedentes bacterium]|nr:hypothetical protein [Candidatus Hydrogenedentota bacterium]
MPDTCDITIILAPKWDHREPSVATAYICQYLRFLGYRVQFLDYNIELYTLCKHLGFGEIWPSSTYHQAWIEGDMDPLVGLLDIERIESEVVGLSLTATNRSLSILLARRIRERYPNKKIILGGYALFFQSDLVGLPTAYADAVCKGEGEHTLRDVLERGFHGLQDVPGLYLPHNGGWRLTQERPLIRDLDAIPWPTFEEVDMGQYEVPDLPLVGSRGCIGNCIF